MTEEVRILIESLRLGRYEDPEEKIGLLSAALRESEGDLALLLSLLRAPQIPLRLAAIDACRARSEDELTAELIQLMEDPETRVRVKIAQVMASKGAKIASPILEILMHDADWEVRLEAIKSSSGWSELFKGHVAALENEFDWRIRFAAVQALAEQKNPKTIAALFKAVITDEDDEVVRRCGELIEKRLGLGPAGVERHLPAEIGQLTKAEKRLKALDAGRFPKLLGWIIDRTNVAADPQVLLKFGTDLTSLAEDGTLPRAHRLDEQCKTILKLLGREPWRSIALLGTAGSGKSALISELVYELARPENGKWRVLRVSPEDFLAGTRFLGEWETKVRELIQAVRKPRRVIIYVPNLSELSSAGATSRSESSVATALAPYLEEGSVLLIGESAPEEFERGLGRIPSLQRLFDKVLLPEASAATTREILGDIRDQEKLPIDDIVLDQLLELSGQFLGHISRPGNAVALLQSVAKTANLESAITSRHVLDSLSNSTGIPADLLDDAIPLNPEEVKAFLQKKVIGQAEAVETVVDLVTLIKAGLTDPEKPFGVFLFVGPTGVGKTELARTLAEYIFGDVARLKRFDMSEFASVDGFERLIGNANRNGLLTEAVRQHPFSVVLLDEIEKSHSNVFDLCLQIFDAGRLTDGRGRTVDFRRTIVILTSNIGATGPSAPLGFGSTQTEAAGVDKDKTFRELSRFFRPEFLNRLDRIVQFRPLSLEVAEHIARREVESVLQRSGIRRRELTIDLEPSVISLLLREGYSPHFGARPLKRTVERLLLLPLARAISSGSIRGPTILHLKHNGKRIQVVASPPSAAPMNRPTSAKAASLNKVLRQRADEMQARFRAGQKRLHHLAERKSELLQQTQDPDFYDKVSSRSAVFDEIHKLDQFLAQWEGLGTAIKGIVQRLHPPAGPVRDESAVEEKLEQIANELDQLSLIAVSKNVRDLGDALVCISLVSRAGENQNGVEKMAEMYRALAKRRRMTAEVLGEFVDEKEDRAYLSVSGLGAFSLLQPESGLHQFDFRSRVKSARNNRELTHQARELIRVDVLPLEGQPEKSFTQAVKAEITVLKPSRKRLLKADSTVSLFHGPSLRSLEVWTSGPRAQALERVIAILQAQAAHGGNDAERKDGIVRHYQFGISPQVKDATTGRATTRVDRVLKGNLDSLRP